MTAHYNLVGGHRLLGAPEYIRAALRRLRNERLLYTGGCQKYGDEISSAARSADCVAVLSPIVENYLPI